MKKLILLLLMFSMSSASFSQELDDLSYDYPMIDILQKLKQPGYDGSTVKVNDDSDIILSQPDPEKEIKGFRVRIFFDNKQSSRSDANDAIKQFEEMYPDMNTYLVYEPPYFKVTAGDFMSRLEAVSVWGKLLGSFPTAFIVSENIPTYIFIEDEGLKMTEKELDQLDLLGNDENDVL